MPFETIRTSAVAQTERFDEARSFCGLHIAQTRSGRALPLEIGRARCQSATEITERNMPVAWREGHSVGCRVPPLAVTQEPASARRFRLGRQSIRTGGKSGRSK